MRPASSRVALALVAATSLAFPLFVARDAAAAGNPLTDTTYCGGPVIANVEIVPIFWTSSVSQSTQSWAQGFLGQMADSDLLDMLSEYSTKGQTGTACAIKESDGGVVYTGPSMPASTNQTITRGTAKSAVTITPMLPATSGSSIDDSNAAIGAEIVAQIKAGKLPAPTYDNQGYPNTIYYIFFPSSVNISLFGAGACQAFTGYHYSVSYAAPENCTGQYIPYAVIPECASGDGLASVCGHELAEAITDSDVGPTEPKSANYGDMGWYIGPEDPCNLSNQPGACPMSIGEVGDVCQSAGDGTIPDQNISTQKIWSFAQSSCALANPNTSKQTNPGNPKTTCGPSSASDGGAPGGHDAGSTSSSGGGSSGGSGGGSSGGGSGGGGGSGSGGGSSSGSSGPGSSGSSSSSGAGSSSGADLDGGTGGGVTTGFDGGPNGATGGSSGGCSTVVLPAGAPGGAGAAALLLGLGLVAQRRRGSRKKD